MAQSSVYDFDSYRKYLEDRLGEHGRRTGRKLAAAEFVGCHSGYLTRVLKGEADLSLEQGDAFNRFMNHEPGEAHFFLLLLQRERAGTESLRGYFDEQIAKIRGQRNLLHLRLDERRMLEGADEARYYSHWYISAIHVLLSIKSYQTKEALASYLGLPVGTVAEALEFLSQVGMAIKEGSRYRIGPSYVYVGPDSPNLAKHHSNWRLKSIDAFSRRGRRDEIHFSAALTLSRADFEKYKELQRKRLEEDMEFFKASEEEGGFALCLDLFEIRSQS